MAITTELVGTLGGGKVSKIDIDFANPSSEGTHDVVTVPIPSGVPHLVALEMKTTVSDSNNEGSAPMILFDRVNKGIYFNLISAGGAVGAYDSAITIKVKKQMRWKSAAFTGTVYYFPLGS